MNTSPELEALTEARSASSENEVKITTLTTKLREAEQVIAEADGAVTAGKNSLDAATTDNDRARARRDLVAAENKLHDAQIEADSLRRQIDAAVAKRPALNVAVRKAEADERRIRLAAVFTKRDAWFDAGMKIDDEIGAIDQEDTRARPNRLPWLAPDVVQSIKAYGRELVAAPKPALKLPPTHVLVKFVRDWPGSGMSSAIGSTAAYLAGEICGFNRRTAAALEAAGVVCAARN